MGRRAVPYLRFPMGLDKAVANDRLLHYSQGLIRNDNHNKSQWSPILSVYLVYLCLSSVPLSRRAVALRSMSRVKLKLMLMLRLALSLGLRLALSLGLRLAPSLGPAVDLERDTLRAACVCLSAAVVLPSTAASSQRPSTPTLPLSLPLSLFGFLSYCTGQTRR
jgi:hypothetical protein